MKTATSRTAASAAAHPGPHVPPREHPLVEAQRRVGNRAVAALVAQRQPAGRSGRRAGAKPERPFDPWVASGIMEALDKIFDTSRVLSPRDAAFPEPYGNSVWLLYQAYRETTAGLFPGAQRLEAYDASMAVLRPVVEQYIAQDAGGREWYDNRLRARLERSRWDVQFGMASGRVKAEMEAGRSGSGSTGAVAGQAAADPSQAKALVDGWLAGVDKVRKTYAVAPWGADKAAAGAAGAGGWDNRAARTRRKAGESKGASATRGELDALGKLEATSAVLKTASTLLTLSDAEFAKKLATLEARGPLGKARSRAEVAKVAVELVADGTKAMHTILSIRAASTGNQDALKVLRGFEQGDLKRIGQLSMGVGILANALTILDNPISKEGLEAGIDIAAAAGKGTPLEKAKDIYDFGKNAVTVLDADRNRAERIDAAMGLIGVAGPLGASIKLTYDGLRALGDLYWGAALGLTAAGVFPSTKRLTLEARGIAGDVERLAATARLLEVEVDPGQRAALQRIAEIQVAAIGKGVQQTIRGAMRRSDERDSPGNIRIFRERFRYLRRYADATDPEQVMQGAIAVMRNAKWCADNQELVIRAEASGTSLADALEWQEQEMAKAERRRREAAEKERKLKEMLASMSPAEREWFSALMR